MAIEILLMAYLRIGNLAPLDTEQHLKPINRSRGTMHLVGLAKALGDVPLLHTSTCYTAGRRKGRPQLPLGGGRR